MSDLADMNEFNRSIVEEFRANGGKVGGGFDGMNMLVLHTTGARSGKERITPLVYQQVGDAWAIFGSKAGATTAPDWYHNLVANPEVTVEVGTETVAAIARTAQGEEHDTIWAQQKADVPGFAEYEKTANRTIPVVLLERA